MIDAYLGRKADLDDGAVHLLFSANRWEKRAGLLGALAAGTTVIADRYAFSGVAFTAAKGVAGLDVAWAAAPDAGLPSPDVVLYLDLPPAVAAARGGFGEERYEEPALLAAVRAQFEGMRARGAGGCEWVTIDASLGVEAVGTTVRAGVGGALARAAGGAPVGALWEGGPLAG
jgi:dTMP kinase